MDYGICLPNFPEGASREGMTPPRRLSGLLVGGVDDHHILVGTEDARTRAHLDAILSLAWIGAKSSRFLATLIVSPSGTR